MVAIYRKEGINEFSPSFTVNKSVVSNIKKIKRNIAIGTYLTADEGHNRCFINSGQKNLTSPVYGIKASH